MPRARPLLRVRGMVKRYRAPGLTGWVGRRSEPAVASVDLVVESGECVGLIGESGSGKTTLVRAALGLLRFEAGSVELLGQPLDGLGGRQLQQLRGRCQLLLQSPDASLNPGLTVRDHLWESARLHQPQADPAELVSRASEKVGIQHRLDGFPNQLSGGEKRRVGIARLLIADPDLTVADEPTAGLDAALKAEITDLLLATRGPERGHLFISHDIPLICYACDRVAVMFAGRIIEEFPVESIEKLRHHPYTSALLAAAGLKLDAGDTSDDPPSSRPGMGCAYRGSCRLAETICAREHPALEPVSSPRHRVACHVIAAEAVS